MSDKRRQSKSSAPPGAADSDDSPKNTKRDRKPATERQIPAVQDHEGSLIPSDSEKGRKRRLQDPLPLEETPRGGNDGRRLTAYDKNASNSAPRPAYYFQHDDRNAAPSGRSNRRRTADDRWTEPRTRSHYYDRARETSPNYEGRRRNTHQDSFQNRVDDAWTHDKFLETQAEERDRKARPSPPKKREFREKPYVKPAVPEDKRTERKYPDTNMPRRERERFCDRAEELERGRWMESDQQGRHQGRRGFVQHMGDRERPGGRFDPTRNSGSNPDKWTHDRFEELNRSPTPKKEEDSIAQIEALLAA